MCAHSQCEPGNPMSAGDEPTDDAAMIAATHTATAPPMFWATAEPTAAYASR
ncbi:hypothetical protein LJ753_16900 [Arthrobacter sp. zg-Y20]|uniref:hypothetical protein n=1 Tax=unclassified Arthrobacter TaxID=235627 RepID=UPI001D14A337|nr:MULTISPECIES: hypothetical protein [unclassified Arthrobacter]MCC3277545.1 hypothetical protein [Arthrobacter sp. zg-Y20]MDK1317703.1 hypothetical protein [Arthrobacter sp. zg.Y20]WIB07038.1 hypothetical protein QNO06_04740 [Arthrobacter sp. zg-Y20]